MADLNLIKHLWVLSREGMAIFWRHYAHDFDREKEKSRDSLISGFFSAMSSFSKEITSSALKGIITETSYILYYQYEDISIVIETVHDVQLERINETQNYIFACIAANMDLFRERNLFITPDTHGSRFQQLLHEIDSFLILKGLAAPIHQFEPIAKEIVLDNIVSVSAAIITNNEKILITGGPDSLLKIWNWENKELVRFIIGNHGTILALALIEASQDMEILISMSSDGYCRFWDLSGNTTTQPFFVGEDKIIMAQFFAENTKLAVYSESNTFRIWSLPERKELTKITDLSAKIAFFLPVWLNDTAFLYFLENGEMGIIDCEKQYSRTVINKNIPAGRLIGSKSRDWIVYPQNNSELIVVNQYTFELVKLLPIEGNIKFLNFIDNSTLIAGLQTGEIYMFLDVELTDQVRPAILKIHQSPPKAFYNRSKTTFFSMDDEGAIRIWEYMDPSTIRDALKNALSKVDHRLSIVDRVTGFVRKTERYLKEETNIDYKALMTEIEYYDAQINRLNFDSDFNYPWWLKATLSERLESGKNIITKVSERIKEFREFVAKKQNEQQK